MSEFAYERLRNAILDGTLKGGTRLVIASLAQSLGVSSTPLREALRDLANEGLVVLDARRGAEVRTIDFDEAAGAYEVRAAIEPLIVRRAVGRITPSELDELARLQAQMLSEGDYRSWIELNAQFHGLIASTAQWATVEGFTRSLLAKTTIHVGLSVDFRETQANHNFWHTELSRSNVEHEEILDACRRGDADGAAAAMAAHITGTLDNLKALHPSG